MGEATTLVATCVAQKAAESNTTHRSSSKVKANKYVRDYYNLIDAWKVRSRHRKLTAVLKNVLHTTCTSTQQLCDVQKCVAFRKNKERDIKTMQ